VRSGRGKVIGARNVLVAFKRVDKKAACPKKALARAVGFTKLERRKERGGGRKERKGERSRGISG